MVRAERDVVDLGHRRLGTEHLLLGLAHDNASVGGRALLSLGITYDEVRRHVASTAPRERALTNEHVPFSAHAKEMLEMSARNALRQEHRRIGTSDLTLSLFGMKGTGALQVLDVLGVDPTQARTRVLEMPNDPEIAPSPAPTVARPRVVQFELSPQAQEFALKALKLGSSYVARRYMPARFAQHAPKATRLMRELNVGPLLRQHLTSRADLEPERRERPDASIARADCSACGTLSPACGTLYTNANGALICERCVPR